MWRDTPAHRRCGRLAVGPGPPHKGQRDGADQVDPPRADTAGDDRTGAFAGSTQIAAHPEDDLFGRSTKTHRPHTQPLSETVAPDYKRLADRP